ncbi:hypothetical protein F4680DRAFT_70057 [Xylaria scruposa]|nr:hypothetical protein F4680DRAFT_70057 [Xylaria scruposa]
MLIFTVAELRTTVILATLLVCCMPRNTVSIYPVRERCAKLSLSCTTAPKPFNTTTYQVFGTHVHNEVHGS